MISIAYINEWKESAPWKMQAKYMHPAFAEDCLPLLRPGTPFDLAADAKLVEHTLIALLPSPVATKKKRISRSVTDVP